MSQKVLVRLVLLAVLVLVAGDRLGLLEGGGPSPGGTAERARVLRVVDGDTVKVSLGGREETVRYIGMDTPESVKPGVAVQCFAKSAARENERLVAGRSVRLVPQREARDRYGRLLADVYRVSDGAWVNGALVRAGYARMLTIPPNDAHAGELAALQAQARSAARGLWGRC